MKQYTIYFHDDLDGTTSAAVLLYFFKSHGDDIANFIPIDFNPKLDAQWPDRLFTEESVIVDFRYHPRAGWWFDHHADPFKNEVWKKEFKNSEQKRWDKTLPSCCGLILNHLSEAFRITFPPSLRELASSVDVVDGALFKSVDEALDLSKPIMQISASFILKNEGRAEYQRALIWALSQHDLKTVAQMPFVRSRFERVKEARGRTEEYYRKKYQITGTVGFNDFSREKLSKVYFLEYKLFPALVFSITLDRTPSGNFHINTGGNPWKKREIRIHIGELMKKFGGGGHQYVGGAEAKTHEEAMETVKKIMEFLKQQ